MTNNSREQSHFPTRRLWPKDGLILENFILQTGNANLYHVIKISLYLPVNVDNIYTKIRNFMPGSSVRIILHSFYLLISKLEKLPTSI